MVLSLIIADLMFHKLHMHYQISLLKSPKAEWSAFAGCFFQAQRQEVWDLDGALANQQMVVYIAVQLCGIE